MVMHHQNLSSFDVSRETFERLEALVALLEKWNRKINLISKSTTLDIWNRHIEDSAQIMKYAPESCDHWLDLGSGGGLPGLVIAIIGAEHDRIKKVTMVESDGRKCAFLTEASRQLALPVEVINQRIEAISPQDADVVSARALADLSILLGFCYPHVGERSKLLFPKGANHLAEIQRARESWRFQLEVHPSMTDPSAAVLEISDLARN